MRKLDPLAVALPAFLLVCLATASLTTTARAQDKPTAGRPVDMYHVVADEGSGNRYATEGYEIEQANATDSHIW